MEMISLQQAFEHAKQTYPERWIQRYAYYDNMKKEKEEEIAIPHTWQLVNAVAASFHTPDREGMLVLQEYRPGCRTPFNHWGFMVEEKALQEEASK